MKSNLFKRIILALLGIPILIGISYTGGILLYILCILIAVSGSWEMAAMLLKKDIEINHLIITVLPILVVSFVQFNLIDTAGSILLILLFAAITSMDLAKSKTDNYLGKISVTLFSVLYPGLLFSFAILIRSELELGWLVLFFAFVTIWIADTFAYGFGKKFGKKKFAPAISPKKTWVGFYAAFPGAILVAMAFYPFMKGSWSLVTLITASVLMSFVGQIGDLVESAIKRDCGVKDSSNIIPGHGGVLDRFDSLCFALPAVYYFLKVVQ
jgi:phosphatidate cytidylyltransferase